MPVSTARRLIWNSAIASYLRTRSAGQLLTSRRSAKRCCSLAGKRETRKWLNRKWFAHWRIRCSTSYSVCTASKFAVDKNSGDQPCCRSMLSGSLIFRFQQPARRAGLVCILSPETSWSIPGQAASKNATVAVFPRETARGRNSCGCFQGAPVASIRYRPLKFGGVLAAFE